MTSAGSGLELRALRAEIVAGLAEVRTGAVELRSEVRTLWTEHLGHARPDES
jgi:hypothetical protein